MKDLFTGSLGKLNNHGGSRMFTTPNTVLVPPDYEIETGLPSEAEFVTCSLDGRLWLFQRKNWYYILALKWNEATEKLELAELKIIQKENFIQRGIDWLITDTLFIFIENNVNIILKKHEIKISDLQNIDEQYYYLPAAGEWQILGRYLINRGKKPTSYLTFSGPGFENNNCNIRTVNHHNGIIWTLITEYSLIGRSYIFPVSFLENEDIVDDDFYEYALDYYFYVRSDFEYIDNDGEKKAFIFLDENYPHICRITDIRNNFCLPSKNERIYDLQNRKRIYISNKYTIDTFNNKIFFDINDNNKTYSLNVLGDNLYTEQKFISDKNLQEWINPSDKEIQSISQNNIIFTLNDNNDIVITHLNSELYREILLANKLPLTCRTYGQYQLSLGLKEDNSITVNKLESRNINIPHVTCYQRPFEFKNFNIIDKNGTIVPRGNFYRIETRDWTINLAYGYTHFSYTIKWYDVDNNVWKQSFRAYDMAEEARAYWERHEHKDCYNGIRTVLHGNHLYLEVFNNDGETVKVLSGVTIPQKTLDLQKDINEPELTPRLSITYAGVSKYAQNRFIIRFVEKETGLSFQVCFNRFSFERTNCILSKQDTTNPYIAHHTIQFQISRNKIKELTFDTELNENFIEILQG